MLENAARCQLKKTLGMLKCFLGAHQSIMSEKKYMKKSLEQVNLTRITQDCSKNPRDSYHKINTLRLIKILGFFLPASNHHSHQFLL